MFSKLLTLIVCLISFVFASEGNAATHTAAGCSNSQIQAAINASASGDTVSVPAGSCTWTDSVYIDKGILLQGAGIGITNITLGSEEMTGFNLTVGNATLYRISGFTIRSTGPGTGSTLSSCGNSPIRITGSSTKPTSFKTNFRIDNIRIYSDPEQTYHQGAICIDKMVYGVFDNVHIEGIGRGWYVHEGYPTDTTFAGDHSWTIPLDPGGPYNVYVEDSTYSCVNAGNYCQVVEGRAGGRMVFRYNVVTNAFYEPHAPMSYGDGSGNHGTLYNEIYNNTFTSSSGQTWMAARLRGGTGIIANNTVIDPDGGNAFYLESRRACPGQDDALFGCLTTYPCIDGLGRGPNQVLTPVYAWNNTLNGAPHDPVIYGGCDHMYEVIQEGREYYNYAKPGWSAYTYPHPLREGNAIPPSQPSPQPDNSDINKPTNLRIVK